MKHLLYGMVVAFLFLNTNCIKKQNDPAEKPASPPPFTYNSELQSSKDISYATLAITDINMMMAFLGEYSLDEFFYAQVYGPGQNTITVIHDQPAKILVAGFNNTKCRDGRTRSGSVILRYGHNTVTNPLANPNAVNYRDFGYSGSLILSEYIVDGWKIELFNSNQPAFFTNKLSSSSYNPAQTNLSWEISGKFLISHPTDPSRTILWDGKIIKELINTSDPVVFATDKQSAIMWKKAKVHYTGTVKGSHGSKNYEYNISSNTPLVRDANCSFGPLGSVDVATFHPFISGTSTFTISNYHPRTINHGPAQNCDNSGTVSFATETHNVNFD